MDIQNMQALLDIFAGLGFSSATEHQLLYHACLRQKAFSIKEQKVFGTNIVSYSIFLKIKDSENKLVCPYYDASLRKEIRVDPVTVNGIDSDELEKRMRALDWKQLSGAGSIAKVKLTDKKTWEEHMIAENIIGDLEKLAETGEGSRVADVLKYKYWVDLPLEQFVPNLQLLKGRLEMSQRFYVLEGEGITTDEAFRFLNNRFIQRQSQVNNKNLSRSTLAGNQPAKSNLGGRRKDAEKKRNHVSK